VCGRFALYSTESEIIAHFNLRFGFSMRGRYNIAPSQTIPVITQWANQIDFYRWGFIPSWTKALDETIPAGLINARWETLAEKPAFKYAFKSQRCLIPANGYYEWRNIANKKHPFHVYVKEQPLLAFAGIWSIWRTPTGVAVPTLAIITTESPPFLQSLHPRMPLIISREYYGTWLSRVPFSLELEKFMLELNEQNVGIHGVSYRMNHPEFEGMECIRALNG
jgi:putative SOS response-associated peptidase YedK